MGYVDHYGAKKKEEIEKFPGLTDEQRKKNQDFARVLLGSSYANNMPGATQAATQDKAIGLSPPKK